MTRMRRISRVIQMMERIEAVLWSLEWPELTSNTAIRALLSKPGLCRVMPGQTGLCVLVSIAVTSVNHSELCTSFGKYSEKNSYSFNVFEYYKSTAKLSIEESTANTANTLTLSNNMANTQLKCIISTFLSDACDELKIGANVHLNLFLCWTHLMLGLSGSEEQAVYTLSKYGSLFHS